MFLGGHNRNILGIGLGIPRHEIRAEDGPISSIVSTAQFYNEIRLETGYTDTQNVNPLTNFADSGKPNATQATPSKQGEYVANDINGHPSILVDGVDDFYDLGDTYEDVDRSDFGRVMIVKAMNRSGNFELLYGAIDDNGDFVQSYIDTGNLLQTRVLMGGVRSEYESDNAIFVSGENPYKILGFFWEFSTNTVYITVDGTDVPISVNADRIIDVIDPSQYTQTRNQYIFARNNKGTSEFHANMKSPEPMTIVSSLSDYRNAFTKLNQKYAIY